MTPKPITSDDNLAQILKDIEKHLDSLVRFQYAQIRKQAFADATEERAFELTGVLGRDEICKELRISSKTLTALWNKWFELGLLAKDGKGYKKTVEY